MKNLLQPIVVGIVRCQISGINDDRKSVEEQALATADMLLYRIGVMPIYLALPMMVLTLAFDWSGIITTGRLFRAQSLAQQARQIETWKKSGIGLFRDFIQFYEKMGAFIYFSKYETKWR